MVWFIVCYEVFCILVLLLINNQFKMKRLIISVLVLLVATFIFSQTNKGQDEQGLKNDLVQNSNPVVTINK